MRSLSLSLTFIFAAGLACAGAAANEGGGEGGGGEEGGKAMAAPMPKDQKEYIEKASKLTSLTNRIVEHERHFQEVVRHKAASKDPEERMRFVNTLNEIAKDRNKDVEAFNRIKSDVSLRYPNQGVSLERRYDTYQKKSVEELEGAAGLDELLTRTKKIIDKKYAPLLVEEEKLQNAGPGVLKTQVDEKPKRLRLEK